MNWCIGVKDLKGESTNRWENLLFCIKCKIKEEIVYFEYQSQSGLT